MVCAHSRYRNTRCAKIHCQHWGRHSGIFYAVIHCMRQHEEDSSQAKCCYTFKFPLPSLHNLPLLQTPQCIFAKSGSLGDRRGYCYDFPHSFSVLHHCLLTFLWTSFLYIGFTHICLLIHSMLTQVLIHALLMCLFMCLYSCTALLYSI